MEEVTDVDLDMGMEVGVVIRVDLVMDGVLNREDKYR